MLVLKTKVTKLINKSLFDIQQDYDPHLNLTFSKQIIRSHRRCSIKKGVLKNFAEFTGKRLCWSLFKNKVFIINKVCNFIIEETLALVFFCVFCSTFKNPFFIEHLRETVSEYYAY